MRTIGSCADRAGLRLLVLTLALIGALAVTVVHAPAGNAQFRAPQLSDSKALSDLTACLASRKAGDLVLLIDTSGSLGGADGTDPTAVRVAAAQALVTGLASSFEKIGAKVDVSVAGFDDDVTTVSEFTALTPKAAATLDDQLGSFADRNKGAETDYWSALTWLNATMQAKAKDRGGEPGSSCQLAIWFTDGEFTISARDGSTTDGLDPLNRQPKAIPGFETVPLIDEATANEARDAAKTELCRAQGTADQLRAAGVTLIGIGLGSAAADDPRFAFLRDYVENPSQTCGAQPGRGVFVPAADVGDLFLALNKIGELGSTQDRPPTKVCQVRVCPEGAYSFKLDNTLSKVHIAAVVKDSGSLIRSGIRVEIAPPGAAKPTVIDGAGPDTGTATAGGAALAYRWYPGDPLTIDLTRNNDWSGSWKITFIDTTGKRPDAVSNVSLSLTSDFAVAPVLPSGTPWRAGEKSGPIEFQPQTSDGKDAPIAKLPASFKATATVTMPGKDGAKNLPVSLTAPITIDLPAAVDPGLATVKVVLSGKIAGQALADVPREVAVQVLPPFGSPSTAPNQVVDFGGIEGTASETGILRVTGPDEGDGCVTIAAGSLIVTPPMVDSVTVTGPDGSNCYPVPAKKTVEVMLTLTPGQEGNGHLEGDLSVGLAPASDPGKVTTAAVRYQADMQRLPQSGVKTGILIGALLLGLLLALALIWLARRWSARFPSGASVALQSVVVEVKISADRLTAADGGSIAPPSMLWAPVPPPGSGRRTLMVSGVPLRARAGWRLTEPGYAEPERFAGTDHVGAGGIPPHSDGQGRPRLPLSVQGTWTVLVPRTIATSPLAEVPGRLLLVVDTAADAAVRQHLVASADRDAPALVMAAREKARAADKTAEPEPPPDEGLQYAGFGQPGPTGPGGGQPPGWNHPSAQPTAGWGSPGPPDAGWGQPASRPAPGWDQPTGQQASGWDPPPSAGPAQPPRSEGW